MSYEKHATRLMNKYPSIDDLATKAQKRIPNIAWQYLATGTGSGKAVLRNREGLDKVTFLPQFMKGEVTVDTTTNFLGTDYAAPFGVAPIGLSGLMWARSEFMLAQMAKNYRIPYCLSTVATQTPEAVGPLVGDMGWFQLYPPKDRSVLSTILKRAKASNFNTLVITVDIPALSRREEAIKAGLTIPPKISSRLIWDALMHPAWTWATLQAGSPQLKTLAPYSDKKDTNSVAAFARTHFRVNLDWGYVQAVRDMWHGPLILKGLLHPSDISKALSIGVEGIGVSNHGGRQFDGTPAAIYALPAIVKEVNGRAAIIFDSGVNSGLDIVRALALGADFVLLGRAFMYGVAALGEMGADHTTEILLDDLRVNMLQLGVETIEEIKNLKAALLRTAPI
jgi:L-lactate dehydrogenase (cytochrome)